MSVIRAMYIAPTAGAPMIFKTEVRAIAGLGLEGDRYALQLGSWKAKGETTHKKKRNVTLIALEDIRYSNSLMLPNHRYNSSETRRNFVTYGTNLTFLLGKEFSIGRVRLLAIEPSDPCDRPDKLCGKRGFEAAFERRGGLNCEILTSGLIRLNDPITM